MEDGHYRSDGQTTHTRALLKCLGALQYETDHGFLPLPSAEPEATLSLLGCQVRMLGSSS